jgi:2,3-bisphosphoglycerate-dependent phosphoglycerate mutase
MNRLFLVRHGGSTGNEDPTFYSLNDSAICLTTNGIRQALSTAAVLAEVGPRWFKPGDFALEVYASQYTRAQQTARIALDQMGQLSLSPTIRAVLNERDYGTKFDARMDSDADFDGNDSESAHQARHRVVGFMQEIESVLHRADVLAFSHFGTLRALIANLRNLSDAEMMKLDVPNGAASLFVRALDASGKSIYQEQALPTHVLPKTATLITLPRPMKFPANLSRTGLLSDMEDRK